jgi:hypothetical protein
MRVVREVEHPKCKITIFSWNLKFLIKLEKGPYEQTFKISELDVSEDKLDDILTVDFVNDAVERFDGMHASIQIYLA